MQIVVAATLNHKRARFLLAIILENGLLPSREAIEHMTGPGQKYSFLRKIDDPEKSTLFKYLDTKGERKAYQMLAEFEADTKAQAISNLYISSMMTQHKMLFEYLKSDNYNEK